MSKRSIRKNRHRADKGANRRTWRKLTVSDAIHRLAQATEPMGPAKEWR